MSSGTKKWHLTVWIHTFRFFRMGEKLKATPLMPNRESWHYNGRLSLELHLSYGKCCSCGQVMPAGEQPEGLDCLYSSNDSSLEIVSLALTKTCSWENKRRTATETEKSCVCSFIKLSHAHNNWSRQLTATQPAAKQIWFYTWTIKLTWIRTTFKTQSVPRSKHTPSLLYKPVS